MEHIFISHSQYDKDIKKYFAQAIEKIEGFTFEMMELEDLEDEYAGILISDGIRYGCVGLAVLLGQNVKSQPLVESRQYTHNWVSFEIGVAAGSGKPIIVFEDYNDDINFPIPYLTDYIRYNLNYDDHLLKIGEALKKILPNKYPIPPDVVKCPHSKCNAVYRYWGVRKNMICPVCRRKFDGGELSNRKIPYRFDDMSNNKAYISWSRQGQ